MTEQQPPNKMEPSVALDELVKELIELQPTLNIGTIGHVAHGKSTVVRQISGVKTGVHSKEQERNMVNLILTLLFGFLSLTFAFDADH